MFRPEETHEFWRRQSVDHMIGTLVAMQRESSDMLRERLDAEIFSARRGVASVLIRGRGVEVGAGSRPWPLPASASCLYGDVRDAAGLEAYFGNCVGPCEFVDAQTFDVVAPASLDFIVHAHVIEHLFDPFGSIREALARLKPGGILLMAVPDMRHTFDKWRAPTMFDHLLADMKDGGAGTKLAAYLEHIRDVHPHLAEPIPDDQHEAEARRIMAAGFDVHVHAWTMETLQEHIARLAPEFGFTVEACLFVVNETIVALRKR